MASQKRYSEFMVFSCPVSTRMGHLNMAAVRLAGDETIRNLNLSLEVFYSEISVQFDRRLTPEQLTTVAQIDISKRFIFKSTSSYTNVSQILKQCMGNGAASEHSKE